MIEIKNFGKVKAYYGRSSHEGRGLKFEEHRQMQPYRSGRSSHEGRGLKLIFTPRSRGNTGRSSHEGRGLKFIFWVFLFAIRGRSSHEGRGLKFE